MNNADLLQRAQFVKTDKTLKLLRCSEKESHLGHNQS